MGPSFGNLGYHPAISIAPARFRRPPFSVPTRGNLMPSIARRLHRSRPFSRAAVASLSAIFAIGLLGVVPVVAVPATPGPGYQDYIYKPLADGTGADDVTSYRNQSKLWFNDGRWWGILFDKGSSKDGTYRIQSFNMATQTWTSGIAGAQVDNRNRSHADTLWDGTNLWVISWPQPWDEQGSQRRPADLQVQLQQHLEDVHDCQRLPAHRVHERRDRRARDPRPDDRQGSERRALGHLHPRHRRDGLALDDRGRNDLGPCLSDPGPGQPDHRQQRPGRDHQPVQRDRRPVEQPDRR